jgi:seryl-tRNA synthetase
MKAVAKLAKEAQGAERARLIEEGRRLREQEKQLALDTEAALAARDEAWARVPNLTHPETPRGHRDEDHRELRKVGADP